MEAAAHPRTRLALAVVLLAGSGAWNAGNVGPVVTEIAVEFDVSLAVVGVLAGTLFLGANVLGLVVAPAVGERIGTLRSLRLSVLTFVVGNLVFALSPVFAGLALGRVLVGLGFALVTTIGVVWARQSGGVGMVGVLGGSIQFGIAGALVVGSVLSDLDVDWRVGFLISAALAVAAYLAIPPDAADPPPTERSGGFLRAAFGRLRTYRLAALFVSIYGIPIVLSAWLIEYLVREGDVAKTVAGVLAFVLFALSAAVRLLGARLQERGVPHALLGGALMLAAAGLVALAIDPATGIALAAVVLIASGFGIPYATALTEAQELYPAQPSEPLALMTLAALLPPIVVIPIVGDALADGNGALAWSLTAAFIALAALANVRRAGIPLTDNGGPGGDTAR